MTTNPTCYTIQHQAHDEWQLCRHDPIAHRRFVARYAQRMVEEYIPLADILAIRDRWGLPAARRAR